MTEYIFQSQPYNGDELCEYEEFQLHDTDATPDDILLIPETFVTPAGRCSATATNIVRVNDNYGDDVSYFCDLHTDQQRESFYRDFPQLKG